MGQNSQRPLLYLARLAIKESPTVDNRRDPYGVSL
jgi:hypothetical protein